MALTRREMLQRFLQFLAASQWPHMARAAPSADGATLENEQLMASFSPELDRPGTLTFKSTGQTVAFTGGFRAELASGEVITLKDCQAIESTQPHSGFQRSWIHQATGLRIDWEVQLGEADHFIREFYRLSAGASDLPIRRTVLCDAPLKDGYVSGSVSGCPVVNDHCFIAIEHPLAEHTTKDDKAIAFMPSQLPLRAGQSVTHTFVTGLCQPGQVRRSFSAYLERVRAHPYRPFLHYNSWYDLGFSDITYNEADMLRVMDSFAEQNLPIQSFLHDDGWDDPATLWGFHDGFPNGLNRVSEKATAMQSAPGIWLSPWGGYGNEKGARMETGRREGFSMNADGFALSGPKYFEFFRDRCLELIDRYGINQFKLDGLGNANHVVEGSHFNSDFDAAIQLIKDLRKRQPDLYVNLTYGTFPSPFWLNYADSIWRGGKDHAYIGKGTKRQQWINYRDHDTFKGVVQTCGLFPLHSLMLHGIIFAQHTRDLNLDPFGNFKEEVRSFFASGTQCQELYVSPHLLKDHHWSFIREGAAFSHRYAHLLQDNRWIGGDPAEGEVYGWAGWKDNEGVITLRNPSDKPQSFTVDHATLWELPNHHSANYHFVDAWEAERPTSLTNGTIMLEPFQVVSLYGKANQP